MRERMIGVSVSITRYVSNDPPGFVSSELIDARGRTHQFISKIADVSADDIDANTSYPHPGVIACRIVDRCLDASGDEVIVVDTTEPWDIESTDGTVQFEILRNNIVEFDLGSSVMVRWNGIA